MRQTDKKNKAMMTILLRWVLLVGGWGAGGLCWGQIVDSSSCQQHYTVKIRKAVEATTDMPTTAVLSVLEGDSTVVVAAERVENTAMETPAHDPRLYDGAYAFLPIQPYLPNMNLYHSHFVVYDYIVNSNGTVEDIRVYENNDKRLKSLLIKELSNTHWHPAVNKQGEQIAFRFQKQVLSVKGHIYEEDYDRY